MHFRSYTISVVRSALTSHLNWPLYNNRNRGGRRGRERASGRTDGGGQMSIEARLSAGMWCTQLRLIGSDGDTELRGQ